MSSILALWTSVYLAFAGPVKEVRIAPGANTTEVIVSVDGEVEVRDFTMEGPNRIVLDLFGAEHRLARSEFRNVNRGGIISMNTSQFTDDVVRIVLQVEELVAYDVLAEEGRVLVALENRGDASFEPWSSGGVPSPGVSERPVSAAPVSQVVQEAPVPRFSTTFVNAPIEEVIFTFADISGRSIVAGNTVTGNITATIDDQPWDEALDAILASNGFIAEERESGIIRVMSAQTQTEDEQFEPLRTRSYPVNYQTAEEIATAVGGVLSDRGQANAIRGSNAVVVTDIERVHRDVQQLVQDLDTRTPSVNIQAKIIFVNRTDLRELGVTYDLKDSAGNQLNVIAPGAQDIDGDGVIDLPEEQVEQGTNVVSLGGNSVAALGNANARVPNPTLTLLSSLVIGRHTLINFIEALESSNLSDIQAEPYQTVMNNQPARIQVGQRTPLRVLDVGTDAGGGGGGGGGASIPTATVEFEETGIILETTPTVTNSGEIILELRAERSDAIPADSDVGFIFSTQNANSRVLVRDGETVVIGGLTVTEISEVRQGVPVLMNLPLLGKLFRRTSTTQVQRDLIILVTPTIVQDLGGN